MHYNKNKTYPTHSPQSKYKLSMYLLIMEENIKAYCQAGLNHRFLSLIHLRGLEISATQPRLHLKLVGSTTRMIISLSKISN